MTLNWLLSLRPCGLGLVQIVRVSNLGLLFPARMAFISSAPLHLHMQRHITHQTTTSRHHRHYRAHQSPRAQLVNPEAEPLLQTLGTPARVALTREVDKNESLFNIVRQLRDDIEVVELPCVETVPGPDVDILPDVVRTGGYDWIVLTSPEAVNVFLRAWRKAKCPPLPRLAAVGRATGDGLRAVGLDVAFEPSKATGVVLSAELPMDLSEEHLSDGHKPRVLYAASARAANTVQNGLSDRGFDVHRLNSYSTEEKKFDELMLDIARDVHVVTFASPSQVSGWVRNCGVKPSLAVACIGETSATAARKAGFVKVHYPHNPGLQGWVEAIEEALKVTEGLKPGMM